MSEASSFAAVFFDFDGTLGDSYPAITSSVNHVRAWHGLPQLPEAEVRKYVGRGAPYLLQHTVGSPDLETDIALYTAHHPSVMLPQTRLLPGVADAVVRLNEAGVRLGVCSNKPRDFTVSLLEHLGLGSRFDLILGPEDVARPKPAPDMLLTGLARLGMAAQQALYVGDMTVDVETARAAGVTVWVVPTGSNDRATLEAAKPDRVIDGMGELPGLVLSDG